MCYPNNNRSMKALVLVIILGFSLRAASVDFEASKDTGISPVLANPEITFGEVLTFARTKSGTPPLIKKEVRVREFNFDWLDTDHEIKDSGKYITNEYYALGYDSTGKLARVSKYSTASLNYEVEIYRDSSFITMRVIDYEFDHHHSVIKGNYLKGIIVDVANKYYFMFDSRALHGLFTDAENITSVMQLDGLLKVKHFADFNRGRLLSISKIIYEESMKEGQTLTKFFGEEMYIYNSEFRIYDGTTISEIDSLFRDYQYKGFRKGILKDLNAKAEYLYVPFWIFEGNQMYN